MLTYSQYTKWYKFFNKEAYDKHGEFFSKFENSDKKHNRLFYDIKVNPERLSIAPPYDIQLFLNNKGFYITNYIKGMCHRQGSKNEVRIGKVLEEFDNQPLLKMYARSKDGIITNTDDLQVVVCRHPYDTIGISTDRGWTSCLDMESKSYDKLHLNKLENFIKKGGIATYLIRKGDNDIKNPIARIKIERYDESMPIMYAKLKGQLYACTETHGSNLPEHRAFVTSWINNYNKTIK